MTPRPIAVGAAAGKSDTRSFEPDHSPRCSVVNGSNVIQRRYAHGPGVDEPVVWYEGANLAARRTLVTDSQGSVIAAADSSGALVGGRYTYGPYGEPDTWGGARFRYTGQVALPEVQLYHYKARVYDPVLGRFLQTDPVGYEDDLNLYMYVRNDPLNGSDPTGRQSDMLQREREEEEAFRASLSEADRSTYDAASQRANGALLSGLADAAPIIGDLKGGAEFLQDPSIGGGVGIVVGVLPGGDFARGPLRGAIDGAVDASTPVGRLGAEMRVPPGTNAPGDIGGREYSGHALDRMQERGLVPSVVEDTISSGRVVSQTTTETVYQTGQARVVIDNATGRVVTAMPQ